MTPGGGDAGGACGHGLAVSARDGPAVGAIGVETRVSDCLGAQPSRDP
jgi:hypothetical protein